MSAYVILEIDVLDPVGYQDYKKLAQETLAPYNGRYIVRGGKTDTLEGHWTPGRIVILEFPSVERARAWIDSPEYAPARELRHRYAASKAIVIEGVA